MCNLHQYIICPVGVSLFLFFSSVSVVQRGGGGGGGLLWVGSCGYYRSFDVWLFFCFCFFFAGHLYPVKG